MTSEWDSIKGLVKDANRVVKGKMEHAIDEGFDTHDCHLDEDDGCEACDDYYRGVFHDRDVDFVREDG